MPEQWAYPWNAPRPAISAPSGVADLRSPLFVTDAEPHPTVTRYLSRMVKRALAVPGDDRNLNQAVAQLEHQEPNGTQLLIRHGLAEIVRRDHQKTLSDWMKTPEGVEARLHEQPFFYP
ncbi:hypothetical protein [Dickeya ananatis]